MLFLYVCSPFLQQHGSYQRNKSSAEESEALLEALLECSEDELRGCHARHTDTPDSPVTTSDASFLSTAKNHTSRFLPNALSVLHMRHAAPTLSLSKYRPWQRGSTCLVYETLVDTLRLSSSRQQAVNWVRDS